jgi:hypothetical protein
MKRVGRMNSRVPHPGSNKSPCIRPDNNHSEKNHVRIAENTDFIVIAAAILAVVAVST